MTTIAREGRSTYRALVYEDPDFIPYFRSATPIDVIERLEIGSRPASRRSGGGVESLRAIPWVFSWMQNRHLLPGWYGVGAGLAAAIEAHGEDVLREMARDWPFFDNLLADVEMVLAKADMGIAERYAGLAGETGEKLFPGILAEYGRTRKLICRSAGHPGTSRTGTGAAALDPPPQSLRRPYQSACRSTCWRAGGRAAGTTPTSRKRSK